MAFSNYNVSELAILLHPLNTTFAAHSRPRFISPMSFTFYSGRRWGLGKGILVTEKELRLGATSGPTRSVVGQTHITKLGHCSKSRPLSATVVLDSSAATG